MFHCDDAGTTGAEKRISPFCTYIEVARLSNNNDNVSTGLAKWYLAPQFAIEVRGRGWIRLKAPAMIPVLMDGRIPDTKDCYDRSSSVSLKIRTPGPFDNMPAVDVDPDSHSAAVIRYLLFDPCLFALDLLNTTKNVTLDRLYRVKQSRKELRSSVRLPDLAHHIITIRDSAARVVEGDRLRSAAEAGAHRVRGHYKTYTDAAPLFGRIVGKFWVPSFIKGLDSGRLITSEYRV